ncbi:hypothetical protein [Hymenobacter weizhouensis]|uniref:hypothetical protein n=1 Tax=Hymenobacter sp. YIM 151500-1 TaxID=2987689 RepID=UPI0022269B0C|nr:hypothetical protein [Hymenobacter sp. YIM 151500-1]UYZ64132.1 hypothetical protein OIS53_04610 [Hymenobacter sp. YIM 151500-1]
MLNPQIPEALPSLQLGRVSTFRPEDIKRWGVERFMAEVAPQTPFAIPDLGFTPEEQQRMDQLTQDEREADGL